MGNETQTRVMLLDGSSELVLPSAPVLPEGDTDGCLFGEEAAWELFGSTQVTGDKIYIGNEMRIIRGVINLPQMGVVLGGSVEGFSGAGADMEEGSLCYDRIIAGSGRAEDAENFLAQSGLDGKILRMDYLNSLHWIGELLPGKWSDFSGWEDNFAQKREDFGLLLQVNKNSVEFYYMCQCFLYIWDTVLEVICVMGALLCIVSCRGGCKK